MKSIIWFWLPVIGYMAAIFYGSSLPNPEFTGNTPDYVLHALEYFLLGLLLIRLLLANNSLPQVLRSFAAWQKACLLGFVIASLYGMSDELHQYFIPNRFCTWSDACADMFGAFLAYSSALLDYQILTRCPAWLSFLRQYQKLYSLSYAFYHFK